MAKKKKAPEAKAPLRGLQDTPTNTNSYIVHDPDHELAMKVTDGAVDGVWLDGEELGGGGGGNIAHVTIDDSVNQTESSVYVAYCDDNHPSGIKCANYEYTATGISETISVFLYEGKAILVGMVASYSGNIEEDQYGDYIITGDCTIVLGGGGD